MLVIKVNIGIVYQTAKQICIQKNYWLLGISANTTNVTVHMNADEDYLWEISDITETKYAMCYSCNSRIKKYIGIATEMDFMTLKITVF